MLHRLVRVFGVLLLVGVASSAQAQQPPVEKGNVAVSYAILHDSDISETFPTGWVFAVTGNLNNVFAIVGEVGGSYKSISILGTDVNARVHAFLGGVKFQNAASPKAVPFAQILLGETLFNASFLGDSASEHAFAIQPGAGVDIKVTPAFGVRVQADFRINHAEGDTNNEFRAAFGGVFGFGKK